MNRLQANICLLCVTLCWSLEVILYSCVPSGVPAFATSCVTCLAGAALLLVPFRKRVVAEVTAGGLRFVAAAFVLAALSAIYNTLYIYGLKSFDVASSSASRSPSSCRRNSASCPRASRLMACNFPAFVYR